MRKKFEWLGLCSSHVLIVGLVVANILGNGPILESVPERLAAIEAKPIETNAVVQARTSTIPTTSNTAKPTEQPQTQKLNYQSPTDGYQDGTYTGTANGYGGPIQVSVLVENGKIKSVTIISAASETPSFFEKAKVVAQRIVSNQSPNVDAVSGATYSSNGIINATISALKKAGGKENENKVVKTNAPNVTKKPKEKKEPVHSVPRDAKYADGVFAGSGQGWGGTIKVKVIIKKGKINNILVVSKENETPDFFEKAKAILSIMKKKQTSEVDVISGATYSSNGIKDAVREALYLSMKKQAKEQGKTIKETVAPKKTSQPASTLLPSLAPVKTPGMVTSEAIQEDGSIMTVTTNVTEKELNGTAMCYPDENEDFEEYRIEMVLKLVVETVSTQIVQNGETSIKEEHSYQVKGMNFTEDTQKLATTEGNWFYLKFASEGNERNLGVFNQLLNKKIENVDGVSGATCSSIAIIQAYKDAIEKVNER